jgi:hypothetical protein
MIRNYECRKLANFNYRTDFGYRRLSTTPHEYVFYLIFSLNIARADKFFIIN